MPKSAVIPDDPTEGAIVHAAVNGINEALLKGYVSSIEAEHIKIEEINRKAKEARQPHQDEIKALMKKAAEDLIPKKPFSAKIRERKLLRKAGGVAKTLTPEQLAIFEEITSKTFEMPLFDHLDTDE